MSKRVAVVGLAVLCVGVVSVFAFQWPAPLSTMKYGFGSYRGGFLKGAEFAPGPMTACAPGEIVFHAETPSLPGAYPLAGGGMLALMHHSDLMSVYVGLSPHISENGMVVEVGQFVGSSSDAGRGTRLYVLDTRERRMVNPLAVMDQSEDDKAPVLLSAALSREAVEMPLSSAKEIAQGNWYLLLDAVDVSPPGLDWPAFSLRVLVNGSERASAVYDAAWASQGVSRLFSRTNLVEEDCILADGRIRFGPLALPRGKVAISVIAQDYAGNTREASWTLSVQ